MDLDRVRSEVTKLGRWANRYDDRGRLKTAFTNATVTPAADCGYAASPSAGPSPYNQTYSYDEIGNMLTGPAGSYGYPVSGAGAVRPHAPTTAGTATMVWRADGTLQTKTVAGVASAYTFDALNHLSQVTKAGVDTKMVYWPGGERALLSDSNGVHLYLGSKAERHANTDGTTTQRYYYTLGGTTVGTRSLTTPATGSTWEFLFGDVRGSVTLTVGYGATATSSQWYSPYGAKRGTPTITTTSRGYIGQHTDTTTGLNYLNNRYQDPATGVFLSVDPLVAKTGEPYIYAGGNPTTLSDPGGLEKGANGEENSCTAKKDCGSVTSPSRKDIDEAIRRSEESEYYQLLQIAPQEQEDLVALGDLFNVGPIDLVHLLSCGTDLECQIAALRDTNSSIGGPTLASIHGEVLSDVLVWAQVQQVDQCGSSGGAAVWCVATLRLPSIRDSALATTIGHFIFYDVTERDYLTSDGSYSLPDRNRELYRHELGHVAQWDEMGSDFLWSYLADYRQWECAADVATGTTNGSC